MTGCNVEEKQISGEGFASTTIRRRTDSGEVQEVLRMTQEEFDRIVSEYSVNSEQSKTVRKQVSFWERLEHAQASALSGEELKQENFSGVDAEGFEKAVVLLKLWLEMTQQVMLKEKSFRIGIVYNAETLKTDFSIYTPMKSGKDDIP